MLNKINKFFLSCCLLFICLNAFCDDFSSIIKNESEIKKAQREIVIINSQFPYNLNPHTSNYASEAQILSGLYEGLFSYDPLTLEAVPALVETYKISRNKKTWTFTIRKDCSFSNGEKINAETIYNSWIKLLDPKTKAPFASLLDCIEGVANYRQGKGTEKDLGIVVKGETTLVVRLITPTEHLPKILCHHAFSIVHPNKSIFSGPFYLASQSNTEILLKKNISYWDARNVVIPSIKFILGDDQKENAYLINTGKADWAMDATDSSKILNSSTVLISTQFGSEYFFFSSEKKPWDSPDARNALLYAVNWEELRKSCLVPADTLLVKLRGYPDVIGIGDTDIDYANELLEKAGLKDQDLSITIAIPDTEYSNKQVEILKESWQAINVNLNIEKIPSNEYINNIHSIPADLYTYTWIGDFADPLAFLELFRGSSSLNETQWISEKYDSLLEESAYITDTTERYKKLAEAEQVLLDDGLLMPVSHPVSLNIIDRETIGGWYENSLDIHPLKYLYVNPPAPIDNLVKLDNLRHY